MNNRKTTEATVEIPKLLVLFKATCQMLKGEKLCYQRIYGFSVGCLNLIEKLISYSYRHSFNNVSK